MSASIFLCYVSSYSPKLCRLLLSYAMSAPIFLCYVGSYCPMLCQLLLSYAVSAPIILCYVVSYCPLLWRLLLPYAIKLKKIQNVVILGFFMNFGFVSIFCCMNVNIIGLIFWKENFVNLGIFWLRHYFKHFIKSSSL